MMNETYKIYCLSYDNPARLSDMQRRFSTIGASCSFYEGVPFTDHRIIDRNLPNQIKRQWSFTYGHFEMIRKFYNDSDASFGIFCEDDILIDQKLLEYIPEIITDFISMDIDVLLLGYLIPFAIDSSTPNFTLRKSNHTTHLAYYDYSEDLWGTQMYMISREYAKVLIDKYSNGYADQTLVDTSLTHFSADWTITKDGRRALVYPLLSIEDGKSEYSHEGQSRYHAQCHSANFDESRFI